jgi:hypothetical protein
MIGGWLGEQEGRSNSNQSLHLALQPHFNPISWSRIHSYIAWMHIPATKEEVENLWTSASRMRKWMPHPHLTEPAVAPEVHWIQ